MSIKIRTVFIALGLFISLQCLHSQEIKLKGDELIFDITQKEWGTSKFYSSYKSDEKTPDGQNAIGFKVSPCDKTTYIIGKTPPAFLKTISKMDYQWDHISFWIKPDDSDAKITLLFRSKNPINGKVLYSTRIFKLLGKKWQKIEANNLWNSNRLIGLKLKNLLSISFTVSTKQEINFLISPIKFHLKAVTVLKPLKSADVFKTMKPPEIDGKLNEQCWQDALIIKDFDGNLKAPTQVKLCFDDNNIYVGFSQKITTEKMRKQQTSSDGNVWNDDSFQFFLCPGNDNRTYHQFIVNSLNTHQTYHNYFDQIKDDFLSAKNIFSGKWSSAVNIKPDEWQVEFKIPRNLINGLQKNNIHGMQIYVNNPSLKQAGFWNIKSRRATNPNNFGILNLLNKKNTPLPEVKSENISLSFNKDQPSVSLELDNENNQYKIIAQISNPDGEISKANTVYKHGAKLKFNGFSQKSGIQRLVLALCKEDGSRKVFGYLTAPIIFSKQIPYGNIILTPTPKKVTKSKGHFNFKDKLKIFIASPSTKKIKRIAERVQKDCLGYMQTANMIEYSKELGDNMIVIADALNVSILPLTNMKSIPEKDGYILDVSDKSIVLKANTPAGLLYAVITLSQLERYAFLKNKSNIDNIHIKDWPGLPNRAWAHWHDVLYSKYKPGINGADSSEEQLAGHYDYIERLAIGSKLNLYSLMNPTSIKLERKENRQFSHRCAYMTIKQLGEMAQFCRDNFVEFVPGIHGPSHANWLTAARRELIMPGYNNYDADPTHPDFFKYLFSAYSEIIDATKSKYFLSWLDEWWHKPTGAVKNKYKGKLKREIYYETVVKIHDFLRDKNCTMMMFTDMLQRGHNGGKPFDNYLNAVKLPRDIIMCNWSGGTTEIKYFADLGYISWCIDNKVAQADAGKLKAVKNFTGLGVISYGSLTPDFGYGAPGMIKTADNAWGFGYNTNQSLSDWLYTTGPNIMAMYSVKPNPTASHKFVTLDIKSLCNASYSNGTADLKFNELEIPKGKVGFIPTQVVKQSNIKNVIKGEIKPVIIQVDKKTSSIIFLQTQYCSPKNKEVFLKKANHRISGSLNGVKTAVYKIIYSDDKVISTYVRNSINCGNWQPFNGRVSTALENKYLIDSRYIFETGLVNGKETCLYQYEWVNPRPTVSIKSIAFSSTNTEATPYLFAVTLREPKKSE